MSPWSFSPFLQRNPVFRNFLFASTISLTGGSIFEVAMPLYVLQRSPSVMDLSLIAVALHLPHLLMAPVTGFMADYFHKRRLLLGCDIGQIVLLFLMLIYHYSSVQSIWPLFALILLTRSLNNLFETVANFQLIPGFVPKEDLSVANTWFLSFHRLIQIVGPLLGGLLMGFLGAEACIIANILSFGATLGFTYKMTNLEEYVQANEAPPPMTVRNLAKNFSENMAYIYRSPLFRPFVVMMFVWNLSPLALNSPSLTYYFNAKHHFTPEQYGLTVASFGILGIFGFVLSERLYRVNTFANALYVSSVSQALLGSLCVLFCAFPIAMAFFFSISRISSSLLSMGVFILRQSQIPRERAGGVNAALRMFFMIAAPISALFQGVIIERLGVETSLVLGAIFLWATVWFTAEMAKHYPEAEERPQLPPAQVTEIEIEEDEKRIV